MKRRKIKESTVAADVLNLVTEDYGKYQELVERFIEVGRFINKVYNSDLEKRVKEIIEKNPNNKNIQEILEFTQNINQKHKYDHKARVIFATETIKEFKPKYGLDLRNEFEVVDGVFRWKKDIQDIL